MMAKKKSVKENVCGKNRVLAFIKKRFPEDSHWTDGNCWWFAEILCVRFRGEIWYNPVDNHFVTKIGRHWYDHEGVYETADRLIDVRELRAEDPIAYRRLVRDCIL